MLTQEDGYVAKSKKKQWYTMKFQPKILTEVTIIYFINLQILMRIYRVEIQQTWIQLTLKVKVISLNVYL